ncbi:MAG TPA: hypothetical protein VN602_04155, partial [Gemmatimonadaceae bacterium]|nr:hypothetical protein [Gemmatimonadaceae bacterium]
ELRFSGATGGDYLAAGGTQTIGGRVHGALRAVGGRIHVTAAVARNATMAGRTLTVDRDAVIDRSAYLAGGSVRVDGAVHGGLFVSGGTVVLNGPIGADVEVIAEELSLGPDAAIAGSLRYRVPAGKVHIDPHARVMGLTTALPAVSGGSGAYVIGLLWLFGFLVVGAVIVALLPRLMDDAADVIGVRPGWSAVVGLGWIILLPIAVVLVACTIIGLPLALLAAIVYGISLYIGRVTLAIWLGKHVLGARARTGRSGTLLSFGIGGVLLLLVGMFPVIGSLVLFIATVLGLGALLVRVHTLRTSIAGEAFV